MGSFKTLAAAAAAALAVPWAMAAETPRYRVEFFNSDVRPSGFSFRDLNNLGQVVGMRSFDNGHNAFLYDKGELHPLEADGLSLNVAGINDSGLIAGTTLRGAVLLDHGKTTVISNLLKPPPLYNQVTSLTRRGHVLAYETSANAEDYVPYRYDGHTSRYVDVSFLPPEAAGGRYGFSAMNDKDQLLGFYTRPDGTRTAFVYDDATGLQRLDQGGFVDGHAFNNAGDVVGYGLTASGQRTSFLYRDGVATSLGTLGSAIGGVDGGQAADINNRGWVVGYSATSDTQYAAFLYRDGRMYDLNDLLRPGDAGRWQLQSAGQINDRGQILAYGTSRSRHTIASFLLTPTTAVPEPQQWALMLAGLGFLGVVLRRAGAVEQP